LLGALITICGYSVRGKTEPPGRSHPVICKKSREQHMAGIPYDDLQAAMHLGYTTQKMLPGTSVPPCTMANDGVAPTINFACGSQAGSQFSASTIHRQHQGCPMQTILVADDVGSVLAARPGPSLDLKLSFRSYLIGISRIMDHGRMNHGRVPSREPWPK
jgi:hypothetical protein